MGRLPRDPERIPRVLAALAATWDAHPALTLGRVVALALDRAGVEENESGSRLLLVEDGALSRCLHDLAADSGEGAPAEE